MTDNEAIIASLQDELARRGSTMPQGTRVSTSTSTTTLHIAGYALSMTSSEIRLALKDIVPVADRAQMAMRSRAVHLVQRERADRRGDAIGNHPMLPMWGIACHPVALWALERRHPGLGWLRHDDYWSNRGSRSLSFDLGTLTTRRLALTGIPALDARKVVIDASIEFGSSILIPGQLPDTVTDQLPGRPVRDVFEMPAVDPRIDRAVDRVLVGEVETFDNAIRIELRGTKWICAQPPPADLDSDCLDMPLPLR